MQHCSMAQEARAYSDLGDSGATHIAVSKQQDVAGAMHGSPKADLIPFITAACSLCTCVHTHGYVRHHLSRNRLEFTHGRG